MVIKVTTSDVQEVKAAIQKELEKFTDSGFVTVGIHEDKNQQGRDAGISNASLGAAHHYGVGVPKRPFLDVGVATAEREYLAILKKAVEKGQTLQEALDAIGVTAAFAVQQFMTDLKSPPNDPATIKRKGSSNPLIDTGALRQSISSKTQTTKPKEGLA